MPAKLHGLSGIIPARNCISLDYCVDEAILSMIPVCDEIVVCDSDSDDGTRQLLDDWANREDKIKVINWPWPRFPTPDEVERDDLTRPKGDARMLIAWINHAREQCSYDMVCQLDADEVFDPRGYKRMRQAVDELTPVWFKRANLWGNPKMGIFEAPHGTVCGERVVRISPQDIELCSDEPRPEGEPECRKRAIDDMGDTLMVFHLGFLREQEKFLKKSRVMQAALMNCYDPRLRQAEKTGESWVELSPFPADKPLLGFNASQLPGFAKEWLRKRNFKIA